MSKKSASNMAAFQGQFRISVRPAIAHFGAMPTRSYVACALVAFLIAFSGIFCDKRSIHDGKNPPVEPSERSH